MNKYLFVLVIFIFQSCTSQESALNNTYKPIKKSSFSKDDLMSWYLKDYVTDTIPGISLEKAYKFVERKKSTQVVVAVIDAAFDIQHEDIKNAIQPNDLEQLNGKDDDNNGYVDDIYGWNFVGSKNSKSPLYQNYEVVRVVRYHENLSKVQNSTNDSTSVSAQTMYEKAKKSLADKIAYIEETISLGQPLIENYYSGLDSIAAYLNKREISINVLDEILNAHENLKPQIEAVKLPLLYNMNIKDLEEDLEFRKRLLNIYYNTQYDERKDIGDNPNDLNDTNYGNNLVDELKNDISHGTYVGGIIGANRTNDLGIKGIVNNIKIIPVVVALNGNAHDKDIALGIRYAVDNGADIINISINKEFSLFKEWVFDAIKYAESKDVLIVTAAGNENINHDLAQNFFPNDTDYTVPEISDNFLMVGGTSYDITSNLKYAASNYGQETVDIMAPAKAIYTTASNNTYESVDGTSFAAPIVSGIAALIKSYYPTLTSKELKKIIINSGTDYDVMVHISYEGEDDKLVPFSSLSKSGKVVNAYGALLMAETVVMAKK